MRSLQVSDTENRSSGYWRRYVGPPPRHRPRKIPSSGFGF
jgi:hypothetical protein